MVNRDSGERTLTSVLRWDKLAQRRKSGSIVFRPGCVTIGVVVWSGWLRQHRSILKFGLPQLTRSRAKEDRCSRAKNWFNPCSRGAAPELEGGNQKLNIGRTPPTPATPPACSMRYFRKEKR